MSHFTLLSALVLIAASAIPFLFALRVRGAENGYASISLLLGLTLVVHSLHHIFAYAGRASASVVAGLSSALLALAFGTLYYASWRNVRARA